MRHDLCVGSSTHAFGLRYFNPRSPTIGFLAYSKQVRFGGLALLAVLFASSE